MTPEQRHQEIQDLILNVARADYEKIMTCIRLSLEQQSVGPETSTDLNDPNAPDGVRCGRADYNLTRLVPKVMMRKIPGRVHPMTLRKPEVKEVPSTWILG